jgi:DNA-binding CsgD family transcriptional regulator
MDQPAALVFFSDPGAHAGSRASVLSALYAVTPAECRLAGLLADGFELAGAAGLMKVTLETARSHLKAIFRKTGVRRQAELVRLVLGLPNV